MAHYLSDPKLRQAAFERGRRLGLTDDVIAMQLGITADGRLVAVVEAPPKPQMQKKSAISDDEREMRRLDELVERRRATMPGRTK